MASTIAKTKKSELIDKLSLTCMSKKQPAFETLVRDLHPLTPKILLVILLTVCHNYSSSDVSLENLVFNQLIIL